MRESLPSTDHSSTSKTVVSRLAGACEGPGRVRPLDDIIEERRLDVGENRNPQQSLLRCHWSLRCGSLCLRRAGLRWQLRQRRSCDDAGSQNHAGMPFPLPRRGRQDRLGCPGIHPRPERFWIRSNGRGRDCFSSVSLFISSVSRRNPYAFAFHRSGDWFPFPRQRRFRRSRA